MGQYTYMLMSWGAKKQKKKKKKKKKHESFRHNILTQTQIININSLFIKMKISITNTYLSSYKYIHVFLC